MHREADLWLLTVLVSRIKTPRDTIFLQEYVTVPGKRAQVAHFFKIALLLLQGRVGFELQNALLQSVAKL